MIIFIVAAVAALAIRLYIEGLPNSSPEIGMAAEPSVASSNTPFDIYSVLEILLPFIVAFIVAALYLLMKRNRRLG